ncbi:trypsin-like serine protease [Acaricomes phytoseiuli]|uniref:S1 family peptidase n=1 Tax=Acaricomes phytoseiuli TaxID=291968 RepID=UPI0003A9CBBC|nr:trypsin-like serine protease [Acaricomes phytoseiuli]MCW1250403.1 trypsin-like serine protease [Acaricomes phytoseiuli]
MKFSTFFAGAAIAAMALGGATLPANAQSDAPSPEIVGGSNADFSQVPFTAKLLSNGSFTCTSSVISAAWVLTARHCLGGNISVQVGSASLNGGSRIAAKRTVAWSQGDLALVELAQPYNTRYPTLDSGVPSTGSTGNIYGWGRETPNGPPASQLKTATVRVTGTSTDAYGGVAIAHRGVNGQAWKGDSGGPLIVNGKLTGVASTSASGGSNPNAASYYTSVAYGAFWIQQVTGIRAN